MYYTQPLKCNICKQPGHKAFECKNIKCFKCGQTGHFANECPGSYAAPTGKAKPLAKEQDFCYKCGWQGHKAFECPNEQQVRAVKGSATGQIKVGEAGFQL